MNSISNRESKATIGRLYAVALSLYPVSFRKRYGESMQQTLRDAIADHELTSHDFIKMLAKDLPKSLLKENLAMFRETLSRPALIYNALVLIALCTALSLGFLIIEQQSLRQSANDPQLGMATDLVARLNRGVAPAVAVPNDQTDMDASLSPFVIAFNEQGQVLASSAQLNGAVPTLPSGVLDHARKTGEERVTWAPRRDVRIASVVLHVRSQQGGFVLAGRNLREVESRKDLLMQLTILVWLGLIGIVFAGTFLFGWLSRHPRPQTA